MPARFQPGVASTPKSLWVIGSRRPPLPLQSCATAVYIPALEERLEREQSLARIDRGRERLIGLVVLPCLRQRLARIGQRSAINGRIRRRESRAGGEHAGGNHGDRPLLSSPGSELVQRTLETHVSPD